MDKLAVIFGVGGQDGTYLSEFLLEKDYYTVGVIRRSSYDNTIRLSAAQQNKHFELIEGDVADPTSVMNIINHYQPTEVYNLAAQSHVATSFGQPHYTFQVNTGGVLNILEAIKNTSLNSKFYQASTSELFGNNVTYHPDGVSFDKPYQDENTAFSPCSPYAVSKLAAHYLVSTYRQSYGIHGSCGILFNHESPIRGAKFVTKKITTYVGKLHEWSVKNGGFPHEVKQAYPKLELGNLDSTRDWGFAGDYVKAMWMMLQQKKPDDYVVATGESHSVREFVDLAFKEIGINNWQEYVFIDPKLYRPAEVNHLLGKADKAKEILGWEPTVKFNDLVKMMVQYEKQILGY
jgi:GDPmannose 4,6-dehydratase